MTEVLATVFLVTLAIGSYAIWKSAWKSAIPSLVPPTRHKRPYPRPYLGEDPELQRISRDMQNSIFIGTSKDTR